MSESAESARPSEIASCGCSSVVPAMSMPADEAASYDAVFKALASAPRRALLTIVAANTSRDGGCCPSDVCACTLADALGLAPSTISHHMSALVGAGLVTATRRGLWVYYRLERDALARVAGTLLSL